MTSREMRGVMTVIICVRGGAKSAQICARCCFGALHACETRPEWSPCVYVTPRAPLRVKESAARPAARPEGHHQRPPPVLPRAGRSLRINGTGWRTIMYQARLRPLHALPLRIASAVARAVQNLRTFTAPALRAQATSLAS